MLLNAKVIGIGAAGNKAAIALFKKYPEIAKDMVLINSTLKDIPEEYHDRAIELDGEYRGCAKERTIANQMMVDTLKSGHFEYEKDPKDCMTIIVTSSEGGTGSGASVLLANYLHKVYGTHIHFFVFTGFEDDVRGLKNTVDLFKELDDSFTVEALSNKSFLEAAGNNRLRAEELANEKFADNVNILLGGTINKSSQNIDESDLLKTVRTPGFMYIDRVNMTKIKNSDDFNRRITEVIDDMKSLETQPSAKRIATVLDVKERALEFIDFGYEVIKKRFGMPFEAFSHVQDLHEPEYLDIIVSGLKMPINEIEKTYEDFKERSKFVDTTADDFFNKEYATNADIFDTLQADATPADVDAAKDDFFKSLGKDKKEESKKIKVVQDF